MDDILQELDVNRAVDGRAVQLALPADELEQRLVEQLAAGPVHVDELSAATGRPVAQVSSALALLELKGLVRSVGGMQYGLREAAAEYAHG